eukprot:CFRG1529T1
MNGDKERMTTAPVSANKEEELELFEYETQYFGFTPVSFTDSVTNAINDAVFEAIDELLEVLLKRGFPKDRAVNDLKNVLSKLQGSIDRNFDLFELYSLCNIFKIPQGVWIPSDKAGPSTYGKSEEQAVDDELANLQAAIKAEKLRQAAIDVESTKLKNAARKLIELRDRIESLTKLCVANDVQNIGEHITYICETANEFHKEVGNLMTARRAGLRPRPKKISGVRQPHPVSSLSSKDIHALSNVLGRNYLNTRHFNENLYGEQFGLASATQRMTIMHVPHVWPKIQAAYMYRKVIREVGMLKCPQISVVFSLCSIAGESVTGFNVSQEYRER